MEREQDRNAGLAYTALCDLEKKKEKKNVEIVESNRRDSPRFSSSMFRA